MLSYKFISRFATGAVSLVIAGTTLIGPALAETPVPTRNIRENIQERVDERIQNRCERVTTRINERISHYDTNKQRHIENYEKISDKITTLVSRLESKGYDTSKLKDDLKILDQKVREFASLYTQFVDKLKEAKAFACGNSQGEFLLAVQEAQGFLKQAREKAAEIRTFLQTTIKGDLQQLRAQTPVQN